MQIGLHFNWQDLELDVATTYVDEADDSGERHWGECGYCDWNGPQRRDMPLALEDAKAHQRAEHG